MIVGNKSTHRSDEFKQYPTFIRELHKSLEPCLTNYDRLWLILTGEVVPRPSECGVIVSHFRKHGWKVNARDFSRSTAASNHPMFVNLRMLLRTLGKTSLMNLFFGGSDSKLSSHSSLNIPRSPVQTSRGKSGEDNVEDKM